MPPQPPPPWTLPAVAVLDGGVGHALKMARGEGKFLGGALAAMEGAGEVVAVHRAFIAAGADVVTAASFGVTPRALAASGMPDADLERLVTACVAAARRAADAAPRAVGVAAPLPPLGDCYAAMDAADAEAATATYARIARAALAAGADVLLAETMAGSADAVAALRGAAAAGAGGDRVWVSWTVRDGDGATTRGGERVVDAAAAAVAAAAPGPPPAVLAVNCASPAAVAAGVTALIPVAAAAGARVGSYPNAFAATTDAHLRATGGASEAAPGGAPPAVVAAADFGAGVRDALSAGATLVGGCCGAGAAHVAAVRGAVDAWARREEGG